MALGIHRIIEAIYPELASSSSLDVFVDMALELTDRRFFGKLASHAIAYRACHLFMITGGDPVFGTGQVSSMKEGGLSVSFATNGVTDTSGLDTTKFGKLLLGLIKSRPAMGVNTAGLHKPVR
jgi:hypothetical protein